MKATAGVRIVFLGNPLRGDDAAGLRALALCRRFSWPDGVELVDGGTGGVSLLPLFRHCRRVILVDTFLTAGRAGGINLLRNVTADALAGSDGAEHGGGIKGLLALVPQLVSPAPVVDLMVIGGHRFTPCTIELSHELACALPALCRRLHGYVTEELMPPGLASEAPAGYRLHITGCVQGVGFRPFVYRLATGLGLVGEVGNIGTGVQIRLAADEPTVAAFCRRLRAECPPHARIERIDTEPFDWVSAPRVFEVVNSQTKGQGARIPPDLAPCPACLAELNDATDRRHGYPFINCTNCGPRYSIVRALPWDRAHTAMADFALCTACDEEYGDPGNRRFHAEPVACAVCGPHLWLQGAEGQHIQGSAATLLAQCATWLKQGRVLALKGIGGFQLACDAGSATAIGLLRERKHRPAKPFAVMMRDLAQVDAWFELNDAEQAQLSSPAAPIVLLPRARLRPRLAGMAADALAPGLAHLGVMVASSPLHWLLLNELDGPLVMTSGNAGGEPICTGNRQALSALAPLADAFLLHDRPIVNRCDDSVLAVVAGRPKLIRRARGFVPEPIPLPAGLNGTVLALGADLKNSCCLAGSGRAVLSAHMGDLASPACLDALGQEVERLPALLGLKPRAIAVDLHADYAATRLGVRLARERGLPLYRVQHHHAHLVSCLVENSHGPNEPVLGVVLDGLGLGDDGSLWGGEFMLADYAAYHRLGRLRPFPLLGGDQASRQPWRNLLAQRVSFSLWPELQSRCPLLFRDEAETLLAMAPRFPLTSSAGRLFDAVAALLGVAPAEQSFEGEAAMKLESLAGRAQASACYDVRVSREGELWQLDPAPMWPMMINALLAGASEAVLAANFHLSLVSGLCRMVQQLQRQARFDVVALSGGVMQNRLLLAALIEALEAMGLMVLTQSRVPSNDGGIALGQAAIALARGRSRGKAPR
ncbi:carbamoyltransferase HypF [Zobellella denitrificans]|uniref:carbamoyltransferase HypF n=1 Tax=Zobellella denitrificans TaxID=347534 RepID=UPI000B8BE138|nr:carbamoyltransferase HypF [Zobellella denitrificans]OXS16891.1 carbamoyltransferase HypF [Zobellella denitrificans]